jgi:hypothetical protein
MRVHRDGDGRVPELFFYIREAFTRLNQHRREGMTERVRLAIPQPCPLEQRNPDQTAEVFWHHGIPFSTRKEPNEGITS